MNTSIYTQLGILFKKLTGVQDVSLLRKNIHKRIGKLFYQKKYNSADIVNTMARMGVKPGSVVFIHSSMKEFYNFQGTAQELINAIIQYLTPEGTLIMPAFPFTDIRKINLDDFIFDPVTQKTAGGYLAETFRHYPNVKRSNNVQHSVCAWGKYAEWLTKDHTLGHDCWDEFSPFYRMTQLNAFVVNLGMPKTYIGTFDHCVESQLYKEHPYWNQFFNKEQTFRYYDEQHNVCQYTCMVSFLDRRTHESNLLKHFGSDIHQEERLSNLLINIFHSAPCLQKMIELGRKGITMYYHPSPKNYSFE